MKRKRRTMLMAISIVIAAAFIGILLYNNQTADTGNTNQEIVSQNQEGDTSEADSKQESSSAQQTSETEASQTEAKPSVAESPMESIAGKCYYLFDDEEIKCYTFSFDKKENVDLAYFDEENIYGGDPQHFSGYAKYSVSEDVIVMDTLPSSFPDKLELTIKGDKLYLDDNELTCDDELSLNTVSAHFV